MSNTRTKTLLITSIVKARCPRCRDGAMFPNSLYNRRFMDMDNQCPCCGQPFNLDPGVFLGSAYFSYFIYAVVLSGFVLAWYYTGAGIPSGAMISFMFLLIAGQLPVVLRLAKSIWIHLFVKYEGPCEEIPPKG